MVDLLDDIPISIDIIRSYFKCFEVAIDKDRLKAKVSSDRDRLSFQIAIYSSSIGFTGSFPQTRISLERHSENIRHQGVHLQLSFHKIENPFHAGTLYIHLDIDDMNNLLDVSQGFLFATYEMLKKLGGNFVKIRDQLFHPEMIVDIYDKKQIFIEKVSKSIQVRPLELIKLDGSRVYISEAELEEFLEYRKELVPLLRR